MAFVVTQTSAKEVSGTKSEVTVSWIDDLRVVLKIGDISMITLSFHSLPNPAN